MMNKHEFIDFVLRVSLLLVGTAVCIPVAMAQCVPEPSTKEAKAQCAVLRRDEASLKRMLEELQIRLDETGQKKLSQASLAWQNLRDKECALESDFFRGTSDQSLKYIECEIRLMQEQKQAVSKQVQLRQCPDDLCKK